MTLGDLALFYQVFNKGQGLLASFIGNIGNVYNSTLFLERLFEFLELKPHVAEPKDPISAPSCLKKGISFRKVTFSYPGSKNTALKNFTCSFPAGKIVAIVGANGAGKTTLMKLLCRLYDPDAGSVEVDGHDIRSFSVINYRRMISAMFQFPLVHVATAADNIGIGDLNSEFSSAEIEKAARKAGAHNFIKKLPKGYDTLLGKYFPEGCNISGGERQRLTLARAYLRNSPIMILDEPTSLIDSWSEMDWFDRFQKLAAGRTSILITHRLTIAKNADLIYVMDAGQIVESGHHDELLAMKGRYAASWHAQFDSNPKLADMSDKKATAAVNFSLKINETSDGLLKVS